MSYQFTESHRGNKCILLSERSWSKKATYINYRTFWKQQNYGDGKKIHAFQGLVRWGMNRLTTEDFYGSETTLCDAIISSVQLLSCVQLFATPWTAACQASLSITKSWNLLRLMPIKPSHPLSSPFLPAFNLSQQQGLFQWVSSSHQVAKVSEFQLQHQSFQRIFRTDFL